MGRCLTIETVKPAELSQDEIALWTDIVRADARYASPFFHPAFALAAGQVAPGAAVAVLHDGGRIAGFFPHQRRGAAVQPLAAPMNDYHGVISVPGAETPLEFLPDLLGAGSATVGGWVPEADATPPAGVSARRTLQADLSDGWDAYLEGRFAANRKYFKDKERARRSMARDLGELRVRLDAGDPAMLDRLIQLKSDQYRRSRLHDIFACGWTAELLRTLASGGEAGFGARLAVLEADGEPMAYEFALQAGDRYHFWLPAYEAKAARYSPGILLSMDTMRAASREGFTVFDYGFEGEAYKANFCDRSETVFEGVVHRSPTVEAIAGAAFSSGFGLSVRRRWAAIDACETTLIGRARGIASAAAAALNRTRGAHAMGAVAAAMFVF